MLRECGFEGGRVTFDGKELKGKETGEVRGVVVCDVLEFGHG